MHIFSTHTHSSFICQLSRYRPTSSKPFFLAYIQFVEYACTYVGTYTSLSLCIRQIPPVSLFSFWLRTAIADKSYGCVIAEGSSRCRGEGWGRIEQLPTTIWRLTVQPAERGRRRGEKLKRSFYKLKQPISGKEVCYFGADTLSVRQTGGMGLARVNICSRLAKGICSVVRFCLFLSGKMFLCSTSSLFLLMTRLLSKPGRKTESTNYLIAERK